MQSYWEMEKRPPVEPQIHVEDPKHPLRNALSSADVVFLDRIIPFLDAPMTAMQKDAYEKNLDLLREFVLEKDKDKINTLLLEIGRNGVDIKKLITPNGENIFTLQIGEAIITVNQLERQSIISFIQNPAIIFATDNIYKLFLTDIPFSVRGSNSPTAREVKTVTEASITFSAAPRKSFKLRVPSEAEEFEETVSRKPGVAWVTLSTDVLGMNYAMTFRNLVNSREKYFQFTIPSKDPFTPSTMLAIMKCHADSRKMGEGGERVEYASTFSQAVTQIKDTLRVR